MRMLLLPLPLPLPPLPPPLLAPPLLMLLPTNSMQTPQAKSCCP